MKERRALQGLHLHFEPASGIAGDMTVAALVDLGVPARVVTGAVDAMGVRGLRTSFQRRKRGAFVAKGFVVRWPGKQREHAHDGHQVGHEDSHERGQHHDHAPGHDHRTYADVKRLLGRARLPADARRLAGEIFERIAEVEGRLHGVRADRVAFHEVGAYDSIADVVGTAAGFAWLSPSSVGSTPPVVGSGTVRVAHGRVPVPAPATAALLEGLPIVCEGPGELTTPTGAAILAAVVDRFGPPPPMVVRAVGYGAGTRQIPDRANVLRVMAGKPIGEALPDSAEQAIVLEANIDDMAPQLVAPLFDALLGAGALDVWSTPILMKKGRPALMASALCAPGALRSVEAAFFRNSTTLGLRVRAVGRAVLARSAARVRTRYGDVRVKLAALDGEILGASPEFEDCRRLAAARKVPVREVVAEAQTAARAFAGKGRGRGGA